MPVDPAIKAALDAAEAALTHAIHWQLSDAAAARRTVYAFQHALVSHFHSIGKGDIALNLEAIAEALEAAARE